MSANKSQGTARGQPVEPELKDIAFLLGGAYLIKSFHTGMETGNLPKIVAESGKTFIETICRFPQSIPYFLLSYLGYRWAEGFGLDQPYLVGPASALVAYHALNSMNSVVSMGAAAFLTMIGVVGTGALETFEEKLKELKPKKPEGIPQEVYDEVFNECQAEGVEGGSLFLACMTVKFRQRGYKL